MRTGSIPFLIINGFLGSGKTTFVKRLLKVLPVTKKIAVIQNEFAPSNVDGEELMQSTENSFELLEINNGSVFCVCLLGTFIRSLADFVDTHHPDLIIMEASGLSDPAGIAELFQARELKERVFFSEAWCIVDAAHFEKIERMNVRYRHQVQVADRVIINKTDRVTTDVIDKVYQRVKEINPFCRIDATTFCNIDLGNAEELVTPLKSDLKDRINAERSEGRPPIQSGVIKINIEIAKEELVQLLEGESGKLYRVKGFFRDHEGQGYAIHYVHGDIRTEKLGEYHGPLHLILLGTRVNPGLFARKIKSQYRLS